MKNPFNSKLVDALAEKGTPGVILLGLIIGATWWVFWYTLSGAFGFFGTLKDFASLENAPLALSAVAMMLFLVILLAAVTVFLTRAVIVNTATITEADAKAEKIRDNLAGTFGGIGSGKSGAARPVVINPHIAKANTLKVLSALVERAISLGLPEPRANVFVCNIGKGDEPAYLQIAPGLHKNMEKAHADELTIRIPYAHLSSGRAFCYFRPILSIKRTDGWPHMASSGDGNVMLEVEIKKAHPNLAWISSMPIPHQFHPIKVASAILNVDGLDTLPVENEDLLKTFLTDQAAAASLIGLMNRSSGFLKGAYVPAKEVPDTAGEALPGLMISPEEFDPAACQPPSEDFLRKLGNIPGFEFFVDMTPSAFADFIRSELSG